ncbi:MAG TPA: sigma-54 dependent transcriptional regulator [Thermoanaerobaculia bacterium]|nr:sigma-54 dependent transcriptional regulator [Thermoanaerobaculia bacterium]
MTPRLVVLDDEPRMVESLSMVLRRAGWEVEGFTDPAAALAFLGEEPCDLLISDLRMPGHREVRDGIDVLRRAKAAAPELPVILITAHAAVDTAIEAMRRGAFDYLAKPFDNDDLVATVERALEMSRLARENRHLRRQVRERFGIDGVVAASEAMLAVLETARRAARSASTVLITGESGTGKELVARAIHYQSPRVGAPFVAVNCKALAEGVLESELFGHERGAFTGAERTRRGLFEQAHGGTLFLDEIGEVGADFQAKLLRVLEERTVRRVGGDSPVAVDVRLVAATNRSLREEVEAGRFREDLYYRLAVVRIHLPPLRERREDVLPLAWSFLDRLREELGDAPTGWSPEVEEWLLRHDWPGNVRELENAVERGVVLARGSRIELGDLVDPTEGAEPDGVGAIGLNEFLQRVAAERIREELARAAGVRVEAARRLGIDRVTLYRLIKKYGLEDQRREHRAPADG